MINIMWSIPSYLYVACNDISGVDFRCHFYLNYSVINYFFIFLR